MFYLFLLLLFPYMVMFQKVPQPSITFHNFLQLLSGSMRFHGLFWNVPWHSTMFCNFPLSSNTFASCSMIFHGIVLECSRRFHHLLWVSTEFWAIPLPSMRFFWILQGWWGCEVEVWWCEPRWGLWEWLLMIRLLVGRIVVGLCVWTK